MAALNIVGAGIDLAGFSNNRSSLAVLVHDEVAGGVEALIVKGHSLASTRDGAQSIEDAAAADALVMNACLERAPVAVDVPIDLQRLLDPTFAPTHIWELTRRPVDRAFGALPPLADRLGAVVARFSNLRRRLPSDTLGITLFETYPAAVIELAMGVDVVPKGTEGDDREAPRPSYKGSHAVWRSGGWGPAERGKQGKNASLSDIATRLRLRAADGFVLSDDDVDAILCALVAAAAPVDRLEGAALSMTIRQRLELFQPQSYEAPRGYRLMTRVEPLSISVRTASVEDVLGLSEHRGQRRAVRSAADEGRAAPERRCPIDGCSHRFRGTRGGWDSHVGSLAKHPRWHPDVHEEADRRTIFRNEFPWWFED